VTRLNRRSFLTLTSSSLASLATIKSLCPQFLTAFASSKQDYANTAQGRSCWLDVCAPFVIQDPSIGFNSEIVLTADNFIGSRGYSDSTDATEYEIYLYDSAGRPFGDGGVAKRLVVPAMQTTVLSVADLVGSNVTFWGGLKIRLRPKTRVPSHASDLFSSAFVRWKTAESFANVHANPDPLQWQRPESFFYSMPFPPLREYDCLYSIFNPYAERSTGTVALYDPLGTKLKELPYDLSAHSSVLLDLRRGEFTDGVRKTFQKKVPDPARFDGGDRGGTIAVVNQKGTVKNFGYLLIKQAQSAYFSVEHPIHQKVDRPLPAAMPFDSLGRLKAKNVLYTPLVFNKKQIGGLTLESRFHISSGAPIEEFLWLSPFITDHEGAVVWQMGKGSPFPQSISQKQIEHDVIRLGGQQSCILDACSLDLPKGFSGGLSLAISPLSNHTLMKVELRAVEWGSSTFTHFRPGLASARAYQKPAHRAGLATDYIGSGAQFEKRDGKMIRDELIAVINIDDKNIAGNPTLEIFASDGFVTRIPLGRVPGFSCRHYLLSDLLSGKITTNDLSLRLVDESVTLLMSILHLDYKRHDIAADHGSDRFSTFSEFTCDAMI
jgi:hypothetical protein